MRIGQVRLQEQPVRQPGELVVVREVIEVLVLLQQLRLDLAPHGDIVHRDREHRTLAQHARW